MEGIHLLNIIENQVGHISLIFRAGASVSKLFDEDQVNTSDFLFVLSSFSFLCSLIFSYSLGVSKQAHNKGTVSSLLVFPKKIPLDLSVL